MTTKSSGILPSRVDEAFCLDDIFEAILRLGVFLACGSEKDLEKGGFKLFDVMLDLSSLVWSDTQGICSSSLFSDNYSRINP